jgi:DNA-binding response OmpR family regulator
MGRLLLVENHDPLRELLCETAQEAGCRADCVGTKRDALKLLLPKSHDFVVCNILLPDGNGHEVAAKARNFGIETLLMSGHPEELEALAVSGTAHLAKPFGLKDFSRILREHLPIG